MTRSAQPAQVAEQTSDARIDSYLERLEEVLADMTPEEKQDTLCEIRAHILDSTASATGSDATVDRVLHLLGSPEELAARYNTERMLSRAARSFSPWVLLRACWRWAMAGVKGTLAFMCALFGYGTALALTICVFLKPFMPSRVGVWLGSGSFNIGVAARPERMHELLGRWFVPVIAVAACAIAIGTTHSLRWMMRKRTPKPSSRLRPASLVGSPQI